MNIHKTIRKEPAEAQSAGEIARESLLAWIPVTERHLTFSGISTAVLEGGEGPPVVLLHGPGGHAPHWMRVIPELVTTHRVIAPDLPGHGASALMGVEFDGAAIQAWLGELIARTCTSPPVLVGQTIGGAIAARYAAEAGQRIRGLVLIDAFGLAPFDPEPQFAQAVTAYFTRPNMETHDALWRYCANDLTALRSRMGRRWDPFATYNVDRARAPGAQATIHRLMELFAFPAIAAEELARIRVPTSLIWGRHDLATRLEVAQGASERYGWPLQVIEGVNDDPPIEQPEEFLRALRIALARS